MQPESGIVNNIILKFYKRLDSNTALITVIL